MTVYYISLYPTPGYFRHFVVQAENPVAAVHKLNYQARHMMIALKEQYPKDEYSKVRRAKDIVNATRRYQRISTCKAFGHKQPVCIVCEPPLNQCWEGHLSLGASDNMYAWNILSGLPLCAAQDSRNPDEQQKQDTSG